MMDQTAKFSPKGLKTDFVGEVQTDDEAQKRIINGESQLVYVSTENLIENRKYRRMLLQQVYKKILWP